MTTSDTKGSPDRRRLKELSDLLARLVEVSEMHEQIRKEKADLEARINELAGFPMCPTTGAAARPVTRLHNGSNAALYVEILREHGRPMHVREITALALDRGLALAGRVDKNPESKVRHALYRCRRVVNVGSNVWWLAGEDVPA